MGVGKTIKRKRMDLMNRGDKTEERQQEGLGRGMTEEKSAKKKAKTLPNVRATNCTASYRGIRRGGRKWIRRAEDRIKKIKKNMGIGKEKKG